MRQMKKATSIITMLLCSYLFIFAGSASALSLNGEYSVNVFTRQIDEDSWYFKYDITNNNQQISGTTTGLDGFFINLPDTAVLTDVTVPESYHGSPGYWGSNINDGNWISWWGYNPPSTYPTGSTASFSFYAHNVMLGEASGMITTYWGKYEPAFPYTTSGNWGNYSSYKLTLIAPVAYEAPSSPEPTPEPGTIALLGIGLCGLGVWGRKIKKKS